MLEIKEIFWSFQGEGLRVGVPSIFIRLAGCKLKCPYCDTRDAWPSTTPTGINEIMDKVLQNSKNYPCSQVVITGGEPLEQDLELLVKALRKDKFFVAIETNGIHFQDLDIQWWTVSPKDVAHYLVDPQLIKRIDEFKVVVNDNLNPGVIQNLTNIKKDTPIFLQPDSSDKKRFEKAFAFFKICQERGLSQVRCGYQVHKTYGVK